MAESPPPEAESANFLSRLLDGDIPGFDAAFQQLLRGPAGTDLRRAHLLEEFAQRLFFGDYRKASSAMDEVYAELGYRSPREAAETHEGMLAAKALVSRLTDPRPRGVGALLDSLAARRHQESHVLLDLLQAAWGLTDEEFEQLIGTPSGWLRAWRNHEVAVDDDIHDRVKRLLRLHQAFRFVKDPADYAAAWRRPWAADSPIGHRSPWQAFRDDGEAALDLIEACYSARS